MKIRNNGDKRMTFHSTLCRKRRRSFYFGSMWGGVFLCMIAVGAGAAVDPALLLREASAHVAASDSVQFHTTMDMDFKDGSQEAASTLTGLIIMGVGNEFMMQVKTDSEEMLLFNNAEARHVYLPPRGTYRTMKPETERKHLFRTALSGPLELPFVWLAAFLHDEDMTTNHTLEYVGREEIAGLANHIITLEAPQYTVRVFLSDTSPPLLERFVLDFKGAALRNFARSPEATLRITANFKLWLFDIGLPEDTFVFSPPPDAREEADTPGRPQDKLVGQAAPDFTLPLLDGGTVQLSGHQGKDIVILDFWASWCGPCRRAMPIVVEVANRFKENNVVLYAVNLRESADKARGFLNQNNLSVQVPMDNGEVAGRYGVTGIPRLVLIGRDGVVKAVHAGMSPMLEQQLTREISELLQAE